MNDDTDNNNKNSYRLDIQLTKLEQQMKFWQIRYTELERRLDNIEKKEDLIQETLTKWRGMGVVLVAIGGALGTLIGLWDSIKKVFQ